MVGSFAEYFSSSAVASSSSSSSDFRSIVSDCSSQVKVHCGWAVWMFAFSHLSVLYWILQPLRTLDPLVHIRWKVPCRVYLNPTVLVHHDRFWDVSAYLFFQQILSTFWLYLSGFGSFSHFSVSSTTSLSRSTFTALIQSLLYTLLLWASDVSASTWSVLSETYRFETYRFDRRTAISTSMLFNWTFSAVWTLVHILLLSNLRIILLALFRTAFS